MQMLNARSLRGERRMIVTMGFVQLRLALAALSSSLPAETDHAYPLQLGLGKRRVIHVHSPRAETLLLAQVTCLHLGLLTANEE